MKEYKYTGYYNRGDEGVEFHYNVELDAESKLRFVANMTGLLVGEHYNGIIKDMLFNYTLVSEFTDIDLSVIHKSENAVYEMEKFFDNTDLADQLMHVIDEALINELNDAIAKDIEYKTGIRINSFESSFSRFIDALTKKINMTDVDGVLKSVLNNMSPDKVIEAYMNSDIFKKRNAEIVKARKTKKTNLEVVK